MSAKIVNQGLQRIGIMASQATGYSASRFIRTMSWDDSAVAFAAGDTALNTGGAVTNEFDAALDSTPTVSGQTISHVGTIPSGSLNGVTVRRIALHDDTAANVTTSSTTLIAGVDGQSHVKQSDHSLTNTLKVTFASS